MKDFERAAREIRLTLIATPANTQLAEDLLPLLEEAGQKKLADELFTKLFDCYAESAQQFPKSSLMHNNLAWLSARCGRRLNEALDHAEQAVQLSPQNAGHLYTLAEVHFHRGDRDAAIRHALHAIELDRLNDTFKNQLKRFKNQDHQMFLLQHF